jgi:hypothetical protein
VVAGELPAGCQVDGPPGLRARDERTRLPAPALDVNELDQAMRAWKPARC